MKRVSKPLRAQADELFSRVIRDGEVGFTWSLDDGAFNFHCSDGTLRFMSGPRRLGDTIIDALFNSVWDELSRRLRPLVTSP